MARIRCALTLVIARSGRELVRSFLYCRDVFRRRRRSQQTVRIEQRQDIGRGLFNDRQFRVLIGWDQALQRQDLRDFRQLLEFCNRGTR